MNAQAGSQLIVRGDLQSHTGYSKALRVIVSLMQTEFDRTFGVDLHRSGVRAADSTKIHIVADVEANELARSVGPSSFVVLHFTTPDRFQPLTGAYNIGYFFWETDRFRADLFWEHNIRLMDEMWAPNEFVAGVYRNAGFTGPIKVIPWPHDFSQPTADGAGALDALPIRCLGPGDGTPTTRLFSSVRREHSRVYLAVSSDAPRKGLPILMSEWCEYRRHTGGDSFLILKLSSIDVTKSHEQLMADIVSLVDLFSPGAHQPANLGLLFASLTDAGIDSLYRTADAHISTTLGEGFGGPVVECLRQRKPFISPRHTSLAELIPPDYPYVVSSESVALDLGPFLPVYSPSSIWHVPVRGALSSLLMLFDEAKPDEIRTAVESARACAGAFCNMNRVRALVSAACGDARAQFAARPATDYAGWSPPAYPRGFQRLRCQAE